MFAKNLKRSFYPRSPKNNQNLTVNKNRNQAIGLRQLMNFVADFSNGCFINWISGRSGQVSELELDCCHLQKEISIEIEASEILNGSETQRQMLKC